MNEKDIRNLLKNELNVEVKVLQDSSNISVRVKLIFKGEVISEDVDHCSLPDCADTQDLR